MAGVEQPPSKEKITTPLIDVELTAAQQLRAGGLCVEMRKHTVSDCFTACCLVVYYQDKLAELEAARPAPEPAGAHVDWLGLALELETQAKRVESQTVERAMVAGAHGLRLMGAAQPPRAAHADHCAIFCGMVALPCNCGAE